MQCQKANQITFLRSGWTWSINACPEARVLLIIGWWPAISASSFLCFLCNDWLWCKFCPRVVDDACGMWSLIHWSSASSSNPNLWKRMLSSRASRRFLAGSFNPWNLTNKFDDRTKCFQPNNRSNLLFQCRLTLLQDIRGVEMTLCSHFLAHAH